MKAPTVAPIAEDTRSSTPCANGRRAHGPGKRVALNRYKGTTDMKGEGVYYENLCSLRSFACHDV